MRRSRTAASARFARLATRAKGGIVGNIRRSEGEAPWSPSLAACCCHAMQSCSRADSIADPLVDKSRRKHCNGEGRTVLAVPLGLWCHGGVLCEVSARGRHVKHADGPLVSGKEPDAQGGARTDRTD